MNTATIAYKGVDLLVRLNLDRLIWSFTIALSLVVATYLASH